MWPQDYVIQWVFTDDSGVGCSLQVERLGHTSLLRVRRLTLIAIHSILLLITTPIAWRSVVSLLLNSATPGRLVVFVVDRRLWWLWCGEVILPRDTECCTRFERLIIKLVVCVVLLLIRFF